MLLIGGWMDSYVDPALRMLERCVNAPRRRHRRQLGPRATPTTAYPGPNLDWLHELVRFFDHWLKGVDNGTMDEPALTFFRRDYAPPEPFPRTWPGAWRSEPSFPAPGATERSFWLGAGDVVLTGRLESDPRRGRAGSTGSRTGRRPGRARPCRGAPGARRTDSPGISGSTTRWCRPTRARR